VTALERIIGPLPGAREARAFGVCGIAVALIACGLSLYFGFQGETFLGRPLGSDFVQFYAAGKILNQHQPAKLFDVPYLADMEHNSLPAMPKTQMLIFGNAPCIAAIFRPLAQLSYEKAYCVWLAFSATVYIAVLLMLVRGDRIALLLALATPMFTLETWIGGQVSIFAFVAFALCTRWFGAQRYFLAGLALGLAAYKPSLIAIPAAVFLFGRCWRMLGGLTLSAACVFLASFATVGVEGMKLWLDTMRVFRYLATDQESVLRRSKYVDINSFLTGLFGPHQLVTIASALLVGSALLYFAWTWFRRGPSMLLWSATIAGILILNVYVPVYDTIILIPALLVAPRTKEFPVWVLLFCLVPWLTQSAADFLRVQLLTVVIAGYCAWLLKRPDSERPERSLQ
jgi:hypothetical protein